MIRTYKVTYAIDSLDPNPTVKEFDEYNEMQDWIIDEVSHRVQWSVDHSPYSISEKDRQDLEQTEYSLINIKEL